MTSKILELTREKLLMEFNTKETHALLRRYGYRLWSWGAKNFTNVENKGLLFKVNGHHHKGYVLITLDWSDTYTVHLISTHGNLVKTMEMVYFDQLFDTIDTAIEKIPTYSH